jgi:hypothetical protein
MQSICFNSGWRVKIWYLFGEKKVIGNKLIDLLGLTI